VKCVLMSLTVFIFQIKWTCWLPVQLELWLCLWSAREWLKPQYRDKLMCQFLEILWKIRLVRMIISENTTVGLDRDSSVPVFWFEPYVPLHQSKAPENATATNNFLVQFRIRSGRCPNLPHLIWFALV
jgi:hypothetical protein